MLCFKVLEADAIVQQSEEERYYLRQLAETNDEIFTKHLDIQTQGIKDEKHNDFNILASQIYTYKVCLPNSLSPLLICHLSIFL